MSTDTYIYVLQKQIQNKPCRLTHELNHENAPANFSKWELAQSYPDFQRLVLLSDYFGLSLDALVKDIDVQDVREKNLSEKQLSKIYDDVQNAKTAINLVVNTLAIIGVAGILFFLCLGIFFS